MKERPRFSRNGHIYTPPKTLAAEAKLAQYWDGPLYDCPVAVRLTFTEDGTIVEVTPVDRLNSKLRGDLDNLVKLVMDGLNGVAWIDDKQVVELVAYKL